MVERSCGGQGLCESQAVSRHFPNWVTFGCPIGDGPCRQVLVELTVNQDSGKLSSRRGFKAVQGSLKPWPDGGLS